MFPFNFSLVFESFIQCSLTLFSHPPTPLIASGCDLLNKVRLDAYSSDTCQQAGCSSAPLTALMEELYPHLMERLCLLLTSDAAPIKPHKLDCLNTN